MKNKKGKTIAKQNLPSKICVVCDRPFTWRKKWESNWDDVTTCSKSCNAKRKQQNKQEKVRPKEDDENSNVVVREQYTTTTNDNNDESSLSLSSKYLPKDEAPNSDGTSRVSSDDEEHDVVDPKALKKLLRTQRKDSVKAQKQERRLKREGNTSSEVGRKPCDVCSKEVDMLIRCTIDATQQYRMVCGNCWPSVSGGVTDGNPHTHPHYNYGGVWKNRNATQKKRIGDGRRRDTK